MLTLVRRTLGRVAVIATVVAALLAAFQITIVAVAASLQEAQSFDRLASLTPAFLLQTFGSALASFGGMASVGFFEPLIVMLVVQFAIYLSTEPAGDVEAGFVDLVLARPIPRHQLVTRSLVVMTGAAVGLPILMGVTLWLGLLWLAPPGIAWPDGRVVRLLIAHLAAVSWCFGGAGLAVAAFARRRGAAHAAVGVGTFALYLLDFVGDAWERAHWLAWFSPFHAFHGARILAGATHATRDLGVLVAIGAVSVTIAYWQFGRRDV